MPSATLADDNFHRLTDFLKLVGPGSGVFMLEGFLSAVGNGLTFRYGDETQPGATDDGTPVGAGASATFGTVTTREGSWELRRLWVRNTTPGSNATVVLNARVL